MWLDLGGLHIENLSSFWRKIGFVASLGDGTFQNQLQGTTVTNPRCLVTGDLNNDAKLDVVTVNDMDNRFSVLLGNADGTFQKHIDYTVLQGSEAARRMRVGDFNSDLKPDIVTLRGSILFNECS